MKEVKLQGATVKLNKGISKKPAFLFICFLERASRTLSVILKNPLIHLETFRGSKMEVTKEK